MRVLTLLAMRRAYIIAMELQVVREVQQPDGDVRKLLDVVQSDMLRNLANMTNP